MRLVLIDGDLVVYEAAFCIEKKEQEGKYQTWYQVSKIVDSIVRKTLRHSKATHHLGFLTEGKSNFRLAVATTLPYKGERKTNEEKPAFYDEIRDYLMKQYGFQMMRGVEADDALTIASEHFKSKPKVTTIIATKDKDLWQYPGHHYNMSDKKLFEITEAEAHKNLWRQMILGDVPTDNVPGLSHAAKWEMVMKSKTRPSPDFTYGKVTAEQILDETDPKDYAKVIYGLYISEYEWDEDNYFGDYRFHETWQLIWMLREAPSDLKIHYNPVAVRKGSLEFTKNTTKLEFNDAR